MIPQCKSIMPQRAPSLTKEANKLKKLSCFWDQSGDRLSDDATRSNKVAVKSIKRSAAALEKKGGTCLCGCHYLCHHSNCLPIKKRKPFIGEMIQRSSSSLSSAEESSEDERIII
jgi:hypothetical protein